MIIKKSNTPIVCDINGCKNTAEFIIKKTAEEKDYYGLKLCKECALKIKNLICKELRKKENVNED